MGGPRVPSYTVVSPWGKGSVHVPVPRRKVGPTRPERPSALSWAASPAHAEIAASTGRVQCFRG